jgi:hypothetical protein
MRATPFHSRLWLAGAFLALLSAGGCEIDTKGVEIDTSAVRGLVPHPLPPLNPQPLPPSGEPQVTVEADGGEAAMDDPATDGGSTSDAGRDAAEEE